MNVVSDRSLGNAYVDNARKQNVVYTTAFSTGMYPCITLINIRICSTQAIFIYMEAKGLASLILGGRFVAPNASGGNAANSAISIDETYMYGIAVGASSILNCFV